MSLTSDYADRKATPICTGVLDYFPLALAEVAKLSKLGNDKHNPGEPLHWSKHLSNDHADCIVRHLVDRGTPDADMGGLSHTVAVAWRALALLQIELEDRAEEEAAASAPDYWEAGPTLFRKDEEFVDPVFPPVTACSTYRSEHEGWPLYPRAEPMGDETYNPS